MLINLNARVKVGLTEHGYKIYNQHLEQFNQKASIEQYHVFQLWDLMNVFGSHLYMGCEIPFVMNTLEIIEP